MDPEQLPKNSNEEYNPNLDAQDEELASGGSNRLMYILGGVILALIIAYVALPKGGGGGLASVTPTFMLDDAAVTGTTPTSADSIAAGLKADPAAAAATPGAPKVLPRAVAATRLPATAASVAPAAAPAPASPSPAPAATPTPAPAPAPAPAAAPEPAAPSTITMTGKIDDENGRPMVGATVMLKGSSKGTSTDANGNYSIEVPAGTDNTLMYGYAGYDDETVHTRGTTTANVTLTPRAKDSRRRR